MITKTRYHRATGELMYSQTGAPGVAVFLEDETSGWIDGEYDPQLYRVEDGEVVPISATEVAARATAAAWSALRAERDRRLAACDWTQVADTPVDQAAWAAYRAALRDLPDTTTDPFAPVWPTPPQALE